MKAPEVSARQSCPPSSRAVPLTAQAARAISVDGGQSLRGGADYSAFAEPGYSSDPAWSLVVEGDA